MFRIAVLTFTLVLAGCGLDSGSKQTESLYLDFHKSECGSFELSLCLRSAESPEGDWTNFYDSIEGFDYEWGFLYDLEVQSDDIKNPPEDGSSKKYTLVNINSKEPKLGSFELTVSRAPGLIRKRSEGNYEIYNEITMACLNNCDALDSLIEQDMAILLEITLQEEQFVLSQVKCSASRDSFMSACL